VREFKDGYFEYKDISLEDISDFDNVIKYTDGPSYNNTSYTPNAAKKSKASDPNLHLLPLDHTVAKSGSPGRRGKRGGSSLSYKEHFENYDKMVTKNVDNQKQPKPIYPFQENQQPPALNNNVDSDTDDYQPRDSDIVKKLFTGHAKSNDVTSNKPKTSPISQAPSFPEGPNFLMSPQYFTKGHHPPQPPPDSNNRAPSIQDFILSVQRQKESTLKHSGSTSDVHSLQRQQQPYHHLHQLYHTEPSQIYHNLHHQPQPEPYHDAMPRSYSPPSHLLTPPATHYHQPHQLHAPHPHHQKSLSIGGGETVPTQHAFVPHARPELRVVNTNSGAITAPNAKPMTEEELLASLMPNSSNGDKKIEDKKKNERYAGGMWTSSPPPSSLPVPKFKSVQKK
jgi:hypothetical protein